MKFVYILESVTHPDRHYTGLTDNVDIRLEKHNAGQVRYTSKYAPWRLKTYVGFTDPVRAQEFEKYLKSGSGRAFSKKRL